MKISSSLFVFVLLISFHANAKLVEKCDTVMASASEQLRVIQVPTGKLEAELVRASDSKIYKFQFDKVELKTLTRNSAGSFGSASQDRAALYSIDLFNRWYGNVKSENVKAYAQYVVTSANAQLVLYVLKDKSGKTLFSGFEFRDIPARGFFRVCK